MSSKYYRLVNDMSGEGVRQLIKQYEKYLKNDCVPNFENNLCKIAMDKADDYDSKTIHLEITLLALECYKMYAWRYLDMSDS